MIVDAIDPRPGETLIEIGGGHGELTEKLRAAAHHQRINFRLVVVEKDARLAEEIKKRFSGEKNIEVKTDDIRAMLPSFVSKLPRGSYKLVGNIPYYLTGYLLRLTGELKPKPSRAVFMLQREVAERLAAEPPKMNRLAAMVQFWGSPKILTIVSRRAFSPRPKVDGAVVVIETKKNPGIMPEIYFRAARILFKQPRKTLLNNLSASKNLGSKEEIRAELKKLSLQESLRPQDLHLKDILNIAKAFFASRPQN